MDIRHCVDWFVPVRCADGVAVVQTGRSPDGRRVGIAFTTSADLRAACGAAEWMRLSEPALRDLLEPLGITRIQLDPALVAVPLRGAVAS
ncbi:SAV_915 family protein [Kribbella sp. WER1]